MGMRLVCLGTGDAHSARWYSSALAVEADGAWLLVDCPHPIRKILRESGVPGLDVPSFLGVALTHLHADHASGLEGFAFYSHFALGRPTTVLAHPEVLADLWEPHLRVTMGRRPDNPLGAHLAPGPDAYFDPRPLSETSPTRLGPFAVECRRTRHPIPTFALRVQAGGRTLGLSADTAFDPDLIAWLAEADLIVHETNRGIHTPYEALAALPRDLRDRMRLTHYPDDFDRDASLIEPLIQARSYPV